MNLQEFIDAHHITLTSEWKSRQFWAPDDETECDVWAVTLHRGDQSMDLEFRMGVGLNRAPRTDDVLEVLFSESSHVESGDAEEFAEVMGAEPEDYAKLRATYAAMQEQADRLRELLGDDLYNTGIWDVES